MYERVKTAYKLGKFRKAVEYTRETSTPASVRTTGQAKLSPGIMYTCLYFRGYS